MLPVLASRPHFHNFSLPLWILSIFCRACFRRFLCLWLKASFLASLFLVYFLCFIFSRSSRNKLIQFPISLNPSSNPWVLCDILLWWYSTSASASFSTHLRKSCCILQTFCSYPLFLLQFLWKVWLLSFCCVCSRPPVLCLLVCRSFRGPLRLLPSDQRIRSRGHICWPYLQIHSRYPYVACKSVV